MSPLTAVIISYIAGSIPAAWIAGRLHGVDLRSQGSGNLGASNVLRVLGAATGIAVFTFDMIKGALPVAMLPGRITTGTEWTVPGADPRVVMALICGFAAIVGHVRPVFLGFGKGGKGVATACGVFAALAPLQTVLSVSIFVITVLASGFVSLGSLVAVGLMPLLIGVSRGVHTLLFGLALVVTAFVFWTHRANLSRLYAGEEHRFGKSGVRRRSGVATAVIVGALAVALAIAARIP